MFILGNKNKKTKINNFEIDAIVSENHTFVNNITNYPIEDGGFISDFIKKQPKRLTIEGMTTDTPFNHTPVIAENQSRSTEAFIELINYAGYYVDKQNNIKSSKNSVPVLLNVITNLTVYCDMIITSISFVKQAYSIKYTIEFQELNKIKTREYSENKVSTLKNKAKDIDKQAQKTKTTGEDSKKEVSSSTLYKLVIGK
jgi:hypothetical protein